MKQLLRILVSRVVIVGVLILAQLCLVALSVFYFSEYFALYYSFATVIAVILVCRIVSKQDNPSYKIAWIILILLLPPFGCAMYLIFSGNQITQRLKKKLAGMYSIMKLVTPEYKMSGKVAFDDKIAKRQSDYITETSCCPPFAETHAEYFPVGEEFFNALLCKLDNAEKFIFLEYFIIDPGYMWEKIHEILVRKASQGVDVRVIYDDMGCITLLDGNYNRTLESEGIKCRVFNRFIPILSARLNNRNHRKICVIDGEVGFTGGANIADEYINLKKLYGHWKDNAVMLEGRGVQSLTLMFLSMWDSLEDPTGKLAHDYRPYFPSHYNKTADERGIVQPYTDNPLDDNPVGESIYLNMIYSASEYVWITTPYLIIDYNMKQALCNAAKSGVDVRIVVPGIPDKRIVYEATKSNYQTLLDAGVKLYEYTPGFLHAKTFLCDDQYGTVGTVNLDFRSLYLHFECGVWFYKAPVLRDIKRDFEDMFDKSHKVEAKDCKANFIRRSIRSLMDVIAPLI